MLSHSPRRLLPLLLAPLLAVSLVAPASAAPRRTEPSATPTPSVTPWGSKPGANPSANPSANPGVDPVTGVEDYAGYEGQKTCSPTAKPGTSAMQAWAVATYGGAAGGIARGCKVGGQSEHKEGRAFDWTLDARKATDRARADRFLKALFATGPTGEPAELARRMGVMYVIWNDKTYASYRQFAAAPYVSGSCKAGKLKRCSPTLRHRDHVHVSLSWAGARAQTSWYATPAARRFR